MAEKIGNPLPYYKRGEQDWLDLWKLPEGDEDAELSTRVARLTDDIVLREAVHIWDNCLRGPGTVEGILGGMISAQARLMISLMGPLDEAEIGVAADDIRDTWITMARKWAVVKAEGWERAAEILNEEG